MYKFCCSNNNKKSPAINRVTIYLNKEKGIFNLHRTIHCKDLGWYVKTHEIKGTQAEAILHTWFVHQPFLKMLFRKIRVSRLFEITARDCKTFKSDSTKCKIYNDNWT